MDQQQLQQMQAHNQWVSSLGVPQYGFGSAFMPQGIGFQGVGGGEGGGGGGYESSGGGHMDLLDMLMSGVPNLQGGLDTVNRQSYFNPQSLSPALQGGVPQGNGVVVNGRWQQNRGPSNYNGTTMPTDMANQLNFAKQMGNIRLGQFKQMTPLLAGLFGGAGLGGGFNTNFGQSATPGLPAHA